MGAVKSIVRVGDEEKEIESFGKVVRCSGKSLVPLEVQVAHFTPSTFPLIPVLKDTFLPLCRKSWQVIVQQRERHPEHDTEIHGITAFYNEFYERLAKIDNNGVYEKVLMKHAVGTNKIAAKGAILVRIVDFLLKFDGDNAGVRQKLKLLGQSHNKYNVRPWQYAVFLELFLLTLGSRLKKFATPSIMEAWVNVLAYSLKGMLPDAIDGTVLESEAHVNFVLSDEDIDEALEQMSKSRSVNMVGANSTQSLGAKSHDTRATTKA